MRIIESKLTTELEEDLVKFLKLKLPGFYPIGNDKYHPRDRVTNEIFRDIVIKSRSW